MRLALIGYGRMGKRRANNLPDGCELVAIVDPKATGPLPTMRDWRNLPFGMLDGVIVATEHASLHGIAHQLLGMGMHVLIEKPGGIRATELRELKSRAQASQRSLHVGYTLRFHPSISELMSRQPEIGRLMFVRMRYGHGGRPGYADEWRADLAQGGVLLDLGSHLLSLVLELMGSLFLKSACVRRDYWPKGAEDYASIRLEGLNAQGRLVHALLECSSYEWRNNFTIECYGEQGKLTASGLGGSYGPERLTVEQSEKSFRSFTVNYDTDDSVMRDTQRFVEGCERPDWPAVDRAIEVLELIEQAKESR